MVQARGRAPERNSHGCCFHFLTAPRSSCHPLCPTRCPTAHTHTHTHLQDCNASATIPVQTHRPTARERARRRVGRCGMLRGHGWLACKLCWAAYFVFGQSVIIPAAKARSGQWGDSCPGSWWM